MWAYRSKLDAATLPYAVTHTESTQAGLLVWSESDASLTPAVFYNPNDAAVTSSASPRRSRPSRWPFIRDRATRTA